MIQGFQGVVGRHLDYASSGSVLLKALQVRNSLIYTLVYRVHFTTKHPALERIKKIFQKNPQLDFL